MPKGKPKRKMELDAECGVCSRLEVDDCPRCGGTGLIDVEAELAALKAIKKAAKPRAGAKPTEGSDEEVPDGA